MRLSHYVGMAGAISALSVASISHAECTKDTDCKADRICEAGNCVAPPAASPTAQPAPAAVTGTAPPPPTTSAPPVAPAPAPSTATADLSPLPAAPRMVRHSKGMMIGGIVMTSMAPVALIVAGFAALAKGVCDVDVDTEAGAGENCGGYDATIDGALISALILVGVGVPLIVIGAHKEPEETLDTATIAPWATRHAAGIGLRINL